MTSLGEPRESLLRADAELIDEGRSGLVDMARPEGVRVMGDGGPDLPAELKIGRSETDLVIRGRVLVPVGRRGAADKEVGIRRIDVLACVSVLVGRGEKVRFVGETGGLEVGGGIASIARRTAGSVLPPFALLGLSRAARSGSSEFRLKLVSGLSGVRSRLIAESDGTSSTTTPFNQSCFPPVSESAASTSLVSFEVERSNGEVSFDGDELPCRVLRGGG